jgi:hypothetical protein
MLKRSKNTCLPVCQEPKALKYLSDFYTYIKPKLFGQKLKNRSVFSSAHLKNFSAAQSLECSTKG